MAGQQTHQLRISREQLGDAQNALDRMLGLSTTLAARTYFPNGRGIVYKVGRVIRVEGPTGYPIRTMDPEYYRLFHARGRDGYFVLKPTSPSVKRRLTPEMVEEVRKELGLH